MLGKKGRLSNPLSAIEDALNTGLHALKGRWAERKHSWLAPGREQVVQGRKLSGLVYIGRVGEQTDYAHDEIARQLRQIGVLEPPKVGD